MNGDGGTDGRRVVDGRFELIERLGSGGMGTVWRARDTALHREVALKEVRPPDPAVTDAERHVQRERALREARALARLSHPHVVTVHQIVDAGEDSHPWIVMELLTGRSLQEALEEGLLEPRRAARLGREVLAALRAAHAAGIQHRDVKPANIMLRDGDGAAVLTDFGIAALQGTTALTATDTLIGSPEYMAPERIRGTDDDPASDLWSLGLVLYAAVEGVSPMRRSGTLSTLTAVLEDPVPPPAQAGPLAPVLAALLVRDPAARPDSARLDALLAEVESPPWASSPTAAAVPDWPGALEERSRTRSPGPAFRDHPPTTPALPHTGRPPGPPLDPPLGSPPGPSGSGTTAPAPLAPPRGRTAVVVAALAVVAVAATAALVLALRGGDEQQPEAGNGGAGKASSDPARTATPSTDGPPDTEDPTADPTSAPTTGAPSPTGDGVRGTWIAQLASVPKSQGTAARERQAATLRGKGAATVRHLDSDAYAAFRPGYWVLYSPGFSNGREAIAYCRSIGLTQRNQCVGRYVGDSEADAAYICFPQPDGSTGRCTRPEDR